MPEEIIFATKPKLGLAMLERARAAGLPFIWVAADSGYGADHALRCWLQGAAAGLRSGRGLSGRTPTEAWHRLSTGDGTKEPRLYDWAYVPYGSDALPLTVPEIRRLPWRLVWPPRPDVEAANAR